MIFEQKKAELVHRVVSDHNLKAEPLIEEFSKWLDYQKDWHDYERNGFLFDYRMMWNTFQIYWKLRTTDQHHIELITGAVGKGKSTVAWQRCAMIDPEGFNSKSLLYTYKDLLNIIVNFKRGNVMWVDEGGDIFDSASSITKDARMINKKMRKIRYKGLYIAICFDDPRQMQYSIISKADSIIYKLYNPKGKDKRDRHKGLRFYGTSSVEFIASEIKTKKRDILSIKANYMDGYNSALRPVVNDVNEESYLARKNEAVIEEAEKELAELEEEVKTTEPKPNDGLTYIKLAEARKILPLTPETFKKRIKDGVFRGKKDGLLYFVAKEDII